MKKRAETFMLPYSVDEKEEIDYVNSKGFVLMPELKEIAKNYFVTSIQMEKYCNFVCNNVDRYKIGNRCYYNKNEVISAISIILTGNDKKFFKIQHKERMNTLGLMNSSELRDYISNYIQKNNLSPVEDKLKKIYNSIVKNKKVKKECFDGVLYFWKDDVRDFFYFD